MPLPLRSLLLSALLATAPAIAGEKALIDTTRSPKAVTRPATLKR